MWPTVIVQQLRKQQPPGFVAEPRAHLGSLFEIDVSAYESDDAPARPGEGSAGGAGTAPWPASHPIVAVETELADEYEYAERVYDVERERTLVAAIEFVSLANKDRPEQRNALVGKCAAMLRQGVAVSIVDLVTVRRLSGPAVTPEPSSAMLLSGLALGGLVARRFRRAPVAESGVPRSEPTRRYG